MQPTRSFLGTKAGVDVYLFGAPIDWSTRLLRAGCEGFEDNPTRVALEAACREVGVDGLYSPTSSLFNARMCPDYRLRVQKPVEISLDGQPISLFTGEYADGCTLPPRPAAVYFASADCPIVVLGSPSLAPLGTFPVAFHAGRDSLFDRKWVDERMVSRDHFSVIDAALELFRANQNSWGPNNGLAFARIICGISGKNFLHPLDHPVYSKTNRALLTYAKNRYGLDVVGGDVESGQLDLPLVIRRHLEQAGIPSQNIEHDGIDTFEEKIDGQYVWHSCARSSRENTPETRFHRNGVVIIRSR